MGQGGSSEAKSNAGLTSLKTNSQTKSHSESRSEEEEENRLEQLEHAINDHDTQSLSSNASTKVEEKVCCSRAFAFSKHHRIELTLALISLVLLAPGTYLWWKNEGNLDSSTAMLIALGLLFTFPVLVKLSLFTLVIILESSCYSKIFGSLNSATALFYILGSLEPIRFLLCMCFSASLLHVLRVVADPGWLSAVIPFLQNVITLGLLWGVFSVVASILSLHCSRKFGMRTHQAKIKATLINERLLNILCGESSNSALLKALDETKTGTILVQSNNYFYIEQYIKSHEANGSLVLSKKGVAKIEDLASIASVKLLRNVRNVLSAEASALSASTSCTQGKVGKSTRGGYTSERKKIRKDSFISSFYLLDQEQRIKAYTLFCPQNMETVTKAEAAAALQILFSERRNLTGSIDSTKNVINTLHLILLTGFGVLEVLAAVVIFLSIDFSTLIALFIAPITALSFIFGASLANTFGNIVFLFVVRPYDVGDYISLGPDMVVYEVLKVKLSTTEFLRWDGVRTKMDNTAVSKITPLYNHTVSLENFSCLKMIPIDMKHVTTNLVATVQEKLQIFVKQNPQKFCECTVTLRDFRPPYQVYLCASITHPYPVHPVRRWRQDQSLLVEHLITVLATNGIEFCGSLLPGPAEQLDQ